MTTIVPVENFIQSLVQQSQTAIANLQQHKDYLAEQQSALEQVSADLELQRKENTELQSRINESHNTISTLESQLTQTSSKRQQVAKGMIHLRDALEAEFWKIAAIINEKHAYVYLLLYKTNDYNPNE